MALDLQPAPKLRTVVLGASGTKHALNATRHVDRERRLMRKAQRRLKRQRNLHEEQLNHIERIAKGKKRRASIIARMRAQE